ncbi:acyltransferase [Novosphingobium sediminis]|uniref:Acyltransferase n=2 Tax=Novosphingobium sediminis TaxID=707214 RepID=A0A512AIV7_9SPHN|nr:acyltransferase [Novosphingobium sediminis]
MFFALSGWLITSLLLEEVAKDGSANLGAFYIRRVTRIAPMYYVTMVLYIILSLAQLIVKKDGENWHQMLNALPWIATFNSEYRTVGAGDIFGHAWTLGVEEKFYVIWPIIFVVFRAKTVSAFILSCAVAFFLTYLAGFDPGPIRGYLGLGFGAALAILAAQRHAVISLLRRPVVAVVSVVCIAGFHAASIVHPATAWHVLTSFSTAFLVACLWYCDSSWVARGLSWAPMAFVGRLTFGIYLLHVLVMNVLLKGGMAKFGQSLDWPIAFIVVYGASIPVAYAFYRVVERPCINFGRRLALTRFARAEGAGSPG